MTYSTPQNPAIRPQSTKVGKVWLVGAGPGDPDLLTVKALRVIQQADLILFDNLVSQDIRALFPHAVPAFYVGKRKDDHSIAQQDLNALLLKKANQGLSVVRIKGGDPFVFGRGGEELMALIQAGVDAEVVPGITSASGCTTAAGIPLTHRGVAQGCTFVTAHGETELHLDWHSLAHIGHTLVFYMGVSRAHVIVKNLIGNGLAANTPAAIIENGCRPDQREIIGHLGELSQMVEKNKVQSPALIIVGEVVNLSSQLRAVPQMDMLNKSCA
ncbi:uroporphyrinogen-III C-methyltransferase [Teredinibacter purpureus]|uniref:uroporphyrinogen-III C-methyltransferase n=1 Tax=Teredinibacter purpureus TaxID=2731756 RepID=UPI0005F7AF88|nr:uroporphyrinogen-III C-methyltransferase [Teredinibacter purpureus]